MDIHRPSRSFSAGNGSANWQKHTHRQMGSMILIYYCLKTADVGVKKKEYVSLLIEL